MRDWLRYFFLSFFTDKQTHEAYRRSLLNGLGCYILSLAILLVTLLCGYTASMPSRYKYATTYREAIYDALCRDNNKVTIDDEKISVCKSSGEAVVVNTFTSENSGCNVIVDTREIKNVFTVFEIVYVGKDDETVTYEEYLTLPEEERATLSFTVKYTDTPIEFTDELLSGYETFLESAEDETVKTNYADLTERKTSLEKEEYAVALYELYVTAYYPKDVLSLDLYAFAPTLRTYYDDLVGKNRQKSFFVIYNDLIYARFYGEGNDDVCYTASTSPSRLKNRAMNLTDNEESEAFVDGLYKNAFNASSTTIAIEYAFNLIRLSSFIIIGSLVLALICWLILRFTKNHAYSLYITVFHILLLYTPVSAVVAGLTGFTLSFFVGRNSAYLITALVYIAITFSRMITYTLRTFIKERQKQLEKQLEK